MKKQKDFERPVTAASENIHSIQETLFYANRLHFGNSHNEFLLHLGNDLLDKSGLLVTNKSR